VYTCTLGFSALEESRARCLAAHDEIADPDAAWLAALTGPQQFSDGLAALLDGGTRCSSSKTP
jgi:hypothetical protein